MPALAVGTVKSAGLPFYRNRTKPTEPDIPSGYHATGQATISPYL